MTNIIAIIIPLIYWVGFFIAYYTFKPYDDSWKGWIKDAFLSIIWLITIPLYYILRYILRK